MFDPGNFTELESSRATLVGALTISLAVNCASLWFLGDVFLLTDGFCDPSARQARLVYRYVVLLLVLLNAATVLTYRRVDKSIDSSDNENSKRLMASFFCYLAAIFLVMTGVSNILSKIEAGALFYVSLIILSILSAVLAFTVGDGEYSICGGHSRYEF